VSSFSFLYTTRCIIHDKPGEPCLSGYVTTNLEEVVWSWQFFSTTSLFISFPGNLTSVNVSSSSQYMHFIAQLFLSLKHANTISTSSWHVLRRTRNQRWK